MSSRRGLWIPDPEWKGLRLIAQLNHTSVASVVRDAIRDKLTRHSLAVVDGELVLNPAVWPANFHRNPGRRRRSNGEENPEGRGQIQPGGPDDAGESMAEG